MTETKGIEETGRNIIEYYEGMKALNKDPTIQDSMFEIPPSTIDDDSFMQTDGNWKVEMIRCEK